MKRFCRFIILVSFFILSYAHAGQTLPSQIKEVTLFSGQALVKREAFVSVQRGFNELLIEIEAFRIDKDSVTAKVFGAGEILSVQFKEIPLKEEAHQKIKDLIQKMEDLMSSKEQLANQRKVLEKKESFLESLIDFSKAQIPQDIKTSFPDMQDLAKALEFLGSNLQEISTEKQSLDVSMKEVAEKIEVLKKELNAVRSSGNKEKKVIEIVFNAAKEQKARIETDYLVKNATWEPLYKVSVPMTLSELDLTMFSKILQKTGEDWNQVALSISNVIPLSGVGLPSLSSWTLDMPRPPAGIRTKAARPDKEKAAVEVFEGDASLGGPQQEATFATAERMELPLSFEYRIPQLIDIESRDKETMLPLFSRKISGEFYYYAVPRLSSLTFLVCRATPDKELLSGPLNVYFGGRYIGKTHLGEKKAGELFQLSLGADRKVKARREKVRDKVRETYFGKIKRDTIVRELAYKISVENLKNQSIVLKVLDSIPVSRTDRIEVKDLTMDPEPTEKNYLDKEGVMLWNLKLDPGEKGEITIQFVVTYPHDVVSWGL
jgi:uncharacterized protein (TIGR02231 family)